MNYYKAIIQYDGSDRMGFQFQEGMPTIQGDLNLSLQKMDEKGNKQSVIFWTTMVMKEKKEYSYK